MSTGTFTSAPKTAHFQRAQDLAQSDDPELPRGWRRTTVGDLSVQIQYGTSAKTSKDASGVPVLRMGNIQNGGLQLDALKDLPANHAEFLSFLDCELSTVN